MADLLQSYERDFDQCMAMLTKIVHAEEPYDAKRTSFVFEDAQKLLKQMEVEAMNFASDDAIRKQVSNHKTEFEKIRRAVRKLQQQKDKEMLQSTESFEIDEEQSSK